MKKTQLLTIFFVIAFLTSLVKMRGQLSPQSQLMEDPIPLVQLDELNLDISTGEENYNYTTFTGSADIYGDVIATFNYCQFTLDAPMQIFGDSTAIFNNCSFTLTSLEIYGNAEVSVFNDSRFDL